MQTPFNLGRLRLYRRAGQAPSLPVFVTHNWQLSTNMEQAGVMAIRVKPDDARQEWSAVAGLDVILAIPEAPVWFALAKAIRDANPRRVRFLTDEGLTTLWYGQ